VKFLLKALMKGYFCKSEHNLIFILYIGVSRTYIRRKLILTMTQIRVEQILNDVFKAILCIFKR
jgi:hypothetical protein